MNNNEYLTEERYNKANKKIKFAGVIILLVGLAIIGFGVYMLIVANSMSIPKMGEPNWFDMSSAQSSKQFTGGALCIVGFFVTVVGCMVRFVIPNQRNIAAYQAQQMRPVVQEGIEKISPSAGVAAKEIAKGIKEGLKDEEDK